MTGTTQEPELTCPHIDKLVQSGELTGEAVQELSIIRDINSKLRYGLWHEKARAEAAEAEVARLQAELALSKPLYSRRQIEARVKSLEAALKPFAEEAENWSDSVPDDHKTLCTEPGSSTAHPGSEAYFTVGDLRRARNTLASTGGDHHAE